MVLDHTGDDPSQIEDPLPINEEEKVSVIGPPHKVNGLERLPYIPVLYKEDKVDLYPIPKAQLKCDDEVAIAALPPMKRLIRKVRKTIRLVKTRLSVSRFNAYARIIFRFIKKLEAKCQELEPLLRDVHDYTTVYENAWNQVNLHMARMNLALVDLAEVVSTCCEESQSREDKIIQILRELERRNELGSATDNTFMFISILNEINRRRCP